MLAIISKYKEESDLTTAHEHKVVDEYAQVYAKKEARGRVIDSLDREERESRSSPITGKGQSNGERVLRPRGNPWAP